MKDKNREIREGTQEYWPAFPNDPAGNTQGARAGLTAREYAAIHLRLPVSGTPWLDDIIGQPADTHAPSAEAERSESVRMVRTVLSAEARLVSVESVIAGALFDFMAFITTQEEDVILGARHEAGQGVKLIERFADARNLSIKAPAVSDWQKFMFIGE